jgi:Leucine-rich repeat (LRR) protein
MKYLLGVSLMFALLVCGLPTQAQPGVKIPDKNLEAALRAALQDAKGPLTEAMLANVYVFKAKGKKIANLTGLEKCKNLAELDLSGNQITDLTPLKDLTNIQSLDLSGNKISDIKPLSGLIRLSYLELSDNQISKLEPLAGVSVGPTYLVVQSLAAQALTPTGAPLGALTQRLAAVGVMEADAFTVGLNALSALYLTRNKISDIRPLAKLTRLVSLSLGKNQIKDIKALEKVNKIGTLELKENLIEDISPLAKQTEVHLLMIEKNKIKDLTPLVKAAKADSEGPMRFAPFLDLYLEGNPLSEDAKTKQLDALKKYGVRIKG